MSKKKSHFATGTLTGSLLPIIIILLEISTDSCLNHFLDHFEGLEVIIDWLTNNIDIYERVEMSFYILFIRSHYTTNRGDVERLP